MKKSTIFTFTALLICSLSSSGKPVQNVATFEDYALLDTIGGENTWMSGSYQFYTYQDVTDWGNYYYGFSVSNDTDSTSSGWSEPYRSACGGAYDGEFFGIWTNDYYGSNSLKLPDADTIAGFFINNNAYTVNEMLYCTSGIGHTFDGNDWLSLCCIGLRDGIIIDTVKVALAKEGHYINHWTYIDLSQMGEVDEMAFTMIGSDTGDWGLNTPAYFCIDNVGASMPEGYVEPEMAEIPVITAINETKADVITNKIILNGQIYIIRHGQLFDVTGNLIR